MGGVHKGRAFTASALPSIPPSVYTRMVRSIWLWRANSIATLGDTPALLKPVIKLCRNA
jgi:hypothetical protein